MRQTFDQYLDELEADVQEEGRRVLRALRSSMNALDRSDLALADEVIAHDDAVDAMYRRVLLSVERLLARQAPVASDLRRILALLHIGRTIERSGDNCVTISKLAKLSHGLASDAALLQAFEEMTSRAEEMLQIALDSFAARDVAAAETLPDLDELIDRGNRRVVSHLLDLGGDKSMREWGMRMIVVSRCLERIGDHAVDIGEQTYYLVTGEYREFSDASHEADEVPAV